MVPVARGSFGDVSRRPYCLSALSETPCHAATMVSEAETLTQQDVIKVQIFPTPGHFQGNVNEDEISISILCALEHVCQAQRA